MWGENAEKLVFVPHGKARLVDAINIIFHVMGRPIWMNRLYFFTIRCILLQYTDVIDVIRLQV